MRQVSRILATLGLILATTEAPAATTYRVTFNGNDVIGAAPVSRSESYPLSASNGAATFTGMGFAYPGHVGCFDHVDMTWSNGLSGGAGADVLCSARTEDFVISGPAAPSVTGVMHFRIQSSFGRAGGFPGDNAHGSGIFVRASVNGVLTTGNYYVSNAGTTAADGCLAGLSGDTIDRFFDIGGSFPVNAPFTVEVFIEEHGGCYGNVDTNPGYYETNVGEGGGPPPTGGLRLQEVSGVVMSLPGGYTLNSASWGVTANHFTSIVSVPSAAASPAFELAVAPNPSSAAMMLRFSQPGAGDARIEIFDASGRQLRVLACGWAPAGTSNLVWDGRDGCGASVRAGLYFARVRTNGRAITRRLVRLE